jgi:hypothetical protein
MGDTPRVRLGGLMSADDAVPLLLEPVGCPSVAPHRPAGRGTSQLGARASSRRDPCAGSRGPGTTCRHLIHSGAGSWGPVGLSATQLATVLGARVIALDVEPHRLQRARDFGATDLINPAETPSVRQAMLEVTGGRGGG